MSKRKKTRLIEYFRLWAGGSGDSGTWDTDMIDIPADTPDVEDRRSGPEGCGQNPLA